MANEPVRSERDDNYYDYYIRDEDSIGGSITINSKGRVYDPWVSTNTEMTQQQKEIATVARNHFKERIVSIEWPVTIDKGALKGKFKVFKLSNIDINNQRRTKYELDTSERSRLTARILLSPQFIEVLKKIREENTTLPRDDTFSIYELPEIERVIWEFTVEWITCEMRKWRPPSSYYIEGWVKKHGKELEKLSDVCEAMDYNNVINKNPFGDKGNCVLCFRRGTVGKFCFC